MAGSFFKRLVEQDATDAPALHVTPWRWRDSQGMYFGAHGDVWLYRQIPLTPLQWEDPAAQLASGGVLANIMTELGATSTDFGTGIRALSRNREIHIVATIWDKVPEQPEDTPDLLLDYLDATLTFPVPTKALLFGVRLNPQLPTGKGGVVENLRETVVSAIGQSLPDRERFASDAAKVDSIMRKNGAVVPNRESLRQMEAWYSLGQEPSEVLLEGKGKLVVEDSSEVIEMAAVREFADPVLIAPNAPWILDATTHPQGAHIVSVRGHLEPARVARNRMRQAQRKMLSQMEEEAATQDIERVEDSTVLSLAQNIEDYLVNVGAPLVTGCSIVLGRRVTPDENETYVDLLRDLYEIEVEPLYYRQLAALAETLPCAPGRVNPFLQEVNVDMLAHAGLHGFSNIGDPSGVYVGLCDPDYAPVYLNPKAAPRRNLPPSMGVFGDPGSGKTFLMQMIATQATLAGEQVFFINPKGFDSLASFAEFVDGRVVRMSQLERTSGGFFDPFRYAEPEVAAEIASAHINLVLGGERGFSGEQELTLESGLKAGARAGAMCVMDALDYVEDPQVRKLVGQQIDASTLFALGIGFKPQESLLGSEGLTLIEFDRKLDLPERGRAAASYTRSERISLAALRIVTRATLEILARSGGGVMMLDEAWTFLSSSEGLAALQTLGREGRSQNILPVFATQRVADLLDNDLEGYLSRVFVMKLMEEREAAAALKLCGLGATQERISWLKTCGPKPASGDTPFSPAVAIHRDLDNRHAAVVVAPVPPDAAEAWSTNPEDRRLRAEKQALAAALSEEGAGWARDIADEVPSYRTRPPSPEVVSPEVAPPAPYSPGAAVPSYTPLGGQQADVAPAVGPSVIQGAGGLAAGADGFGRAGAEVVPGSDGDVVGGSLGGPSVSPDGPAVGSSVGEVLMGDAPDDGLSDEGGAADGWFVPDAPKE